VVLAYDEAYNKDLGAPNGIGLANVPAGVPPVQLRAGEDLGALFEAMIRSPRKPGPQRGTFVMFADAGSQGSRYRVWLPAPGTELPRNDSVFAYATESRSRPGNAPGSIADGDATSFVVTFDAQPQTNAWFALRSDVEVAFRRIVFRQGGTFHDGGWFDASAGKPWIEAQKSKDGPWERLAALESYPATTATDAAGLTNGQPFAVRLPESLRAVGLRVTGRPASGDNPAQAFASCAELEAFAE